MSHRSYALAVVAAIASWCLALATFAYLRLPPLVGDLARIGRFSEDDYGFRTAQAQFRRPLFELEPARLDHDIVVVGDSFSLDKEKGWENHVAAATGARIAVFSNYANSDRTWESILATEGYRSHPPKVFILQAVERNLRDRIARTGGCPVTSEGSAEGPAVRIERAPVAAEMEPFAPPARQWFSPVAMSFAFDYVVAAAGRRIGKGPNDVVVARLKRPLFSSGLEDESLFLRADLVKATWSEPNLADIACGLRRAQEQIQRDGRTLFLALLLPDKLSAYEPDVVDPKLAVAPVIDRLELRGVHALGAQRELRDAIRAGQRDVYQPDDTHLSAAGYAIVGRDVVAELRRRGVVP